MEEGVGRHVLKKQVIIHVCLRKPSECVLQLYKCTKSVLRETVKLFEGRERKHYLGSRRRQKCFMIMFCPMERQAVVTGGF